MFANQAGKRALARPDRAFEGGLTPGSEPPHAAAVSPRSLRRVGVLRTKPSGSESMSSPGSWRSSTLAPFRHGIFLAIWTASLVSNFGSLIQGVGASWLMTSIAPSADMVALGQAASSLPIMLFSLLAGATADVWDRRLVMLVAQVAMLLISAALSALAYFGLVTPWLLLGLTFLLGCGAALYGPAWQPSVGEQVPRHVLPAAIALNSLGFNIARTVGPAIGGIVVAAAGAQAAFLLNALSYIGLIIVLLTWKRPVTPDPLPPETVGAAMRAGLRYVRLSPAIRTVLVRSLAFGLCGSAVWALMPLIARDRPAHLRSPAGRVRRRRGRGRAGQHGLARALCARSRRQRSHARLCGRERARRAQPFSGADARRPAGGREPAGCWR